MNKTVQPAGSAKVAIAELQGRVKEVLTGGLADTPIAIVGAMADAALFSVIGFDATSVSDFTDTSSIVAEVLAIEGITLTDTDPVEITITGHDLVTDSYVKFDDTIVGTVELADKGFIVDVVDVDTFTLRGSNSASFTAYTSDGNVTTQKATLVCTDATTGFKLVVEAYNQPNV